MNSETLSSSPGRYETYIDDDQIQELIRPAHPLETMLMVVDNEIIEMRIFGEQFRSPGLPAPIFKRTQHNPVYGIPLFELTVNDVDHLLPFFKVCIVINRISISVQDVVSFIIAHVNGK